MSKGGGDKKSGKVRIPDPIKDVGQSRDKLGEKAKVSGSTDYNDFLSSLALKLRDIIADISKEKETLRKTTFQKSDKSNLPKIHTDKELAGICLCKITN